MYWEPGRYRLVEKNYKAHEYIVEIHEDGCFTRLSAPPNLPVGVKTGWQFAGEPSKWVKCSPEDPHAEDDF